MAVMYVRGAGIRERRLAMYRAVDETTDFVSQRKKIRAILKQLKEPDSMNRIYHLAAYLKQQEKEKSK